MFKHITVAAFAAFCFCTPSQAQPYLQEEIPLFAPEENSPLPPACPPDSPKPSPGDIPTPSSVKIDCRASQTALNGNVQKEVFGHQLKVNKHWTFEYLYDPVQWEIDKASAPEPAPESYANWLIRNHRTRNTDQLGYYYLHP